MDLKSLALVFLTLRSTEITGADTSKATYKGGKFMEHFYGGHSYVSYEIDARFLKEDSLAYQERFCTKNGSGIIVQITSDNHMENIQIEVSEGYPFIHLMKNDKADPECIFKLNQRVTDGSIFQIKIEFTGKVFSVSLFQKYKEIFSLKVVDISRCLTGNFSTFTFLEKGGEKSHETLLSNSRMLHRGKPILEGSIDACIGDSMLNGFPVAKTGHETERHDIDPSCSHHFGTECTDICATSYIAVEGKKCECPEESEIDEFELCKPSCNCINCQNGGSCSVAPSGPYYCKCPPGVTGNLCEVVIVPEDPCEENQCQNNATCERNVTLENKYFCSCVPGYYGTLCEHKRSDPCEEVHCQNNSTCEYNSTVEQKPVCSCLPGYDGDFCEHQRKDDTKLTHSEAYIIAAGIVGGIAFLLVIIIPTIYWRRRSRNTPEEQQSDQGS